MQNVLKRKAKWDNIKFFLMLSVVFGHILYHFISGSDLGKGIYTFIYLYHMPLFIFVSGLFSKKIVIKRQWDRVASYFILYTIIRFLEASSEFLGGKKFSFHLFWTSGPAWYAFAIFVFLLVTILLRKINPRYLLVMSFVLGVLSGLDNHLGVHFASMRICVYYPFFLLGFYADKDDFEEYGISRKAIALVVIAVFLILCIFISPQYFGLINLVKGKEAYDIMNLPWYSGLIGRIIIYFISIILGYAIIVFTPEKKNALTYLGENTLSVYVWHTFILNLIFGIVGAESIKNIFPSTYGIASFSIAFIIMILCVNPVINRITRSIISPEKFLIRENDDNDKYYLKYL